MQRGSIFNLRIPELLSDYVSASITCNLQHSTEKRKIFSVWIHLFWISCLNKKNKKESQCVIGSQSYDITHLPLKSELTVQTGIYNQ